MRCLGLVEGERVVGGAGFVLRVLRRGWGDRWVLCGWVPDRARSLWQRSLEYDPIRGVLLPIDWSHVFFDRLPGSVVRSRGVRIVRSGEADPGRVECRVLRRVVLG